MKHRKLNCLIKPILFLLLTTNNYINPINPQTKYPQRFKAIKLKTREAFKKLELSNLFQYLKNSNYQGYEKNIKKYSEGLAITSLFLKTATIGMNEEERKASLGKDYAKIYNNSVISINLLQCGLNASIESENSLIIELLSSLIHITDIKLQKKQNQELLDTVLSDIAEFGLKKLCRKLMKKYSEKGMLRRLTRAAVEAFISSLLNGATKQSLDCNSSFLEYFAFNIIAEIYGEIIMKIINQTTMQGDIIF